MPGEPKEGQNQEENKAIDELEKWKLFDEAKRKLTVSVKDIIPEMNVDGLTLRGDERLMDEDVARRLVHLPSGLSTSFARQMYEPKYWAKEEERKALEQLADEVEKVFKGQIVVDIGAGPGGWGYLMADRAGAEAYVAVEPVFADELLYRITSIQNPGLEPKNPFSTPIVPKHEIKKIPISIVQEDMLSFLRRLPADSVSVLCSGIDKEVISLSGKYYEQKVVNEIVRVVNPNGAYVGQRFMHLRLPESDKIEEIVAGNKDEDLGSFEAVSIYKKKKK